MVESGDKCHTIRRARKYPIKKGEILQLYTGMRTKGCRHLFDTPCTAARPICIDRWCLDDEIRVQVIIGDEILSDGAALLLAQHDGFDDLNEFVNFFLPLDRNNGLGQFNGQLIEWNPKVRLSR